MRAMSLVSSDAEGEQNEIRNLQEKLESTMKLVANLSGQLTELKEQVSPVSSDRNGLLASSDVTMRGKGVHGWKKVIQIEFWDLGFPIRTLQCDGIINIIPLSCVCSYLPFLHLCCHIVLSSAAGIHHIPLIPAQPPQQTIVTSAHVNTTDTGHFSVAVPLETTVAPSCKTRRFVKKIQGFSKRHFASGSMYSTVNYDFISKPHQIVL